MLSSPTTINSLGEDILLEIFLHLPFLTTLVPAALTCRPWHRGVAPSNAFGRRFRELHPVPPVPWRASPPPGMLVRTTPAPSRTASPLGW